MYSAAASSPGEGVARPCSVSDARKATSAFRFSARMRAAICGSTPAASCANAIAAQQKTPKVTVFIRPIITTMPVTWTAITREVSPTLNQCELTHLERRPLDIARAIAKPPAYRERLPDAGRAAIARPADAAL